MPRVVFPEWLPDQIGIAGATPEVQNVIPIANGYRSVPSPQSVGAEGAITGAPNRLQAFGDTGGAWFNLLGTNNQIYRLIQDFPTAQPPIQVGRPAGYTSDDHWRWVIWGDTVYGVDFNAPLQKYVLGIDTFNDVAVPNGLTARYMAVVRNDFLMMAHTKDSTGTQRERVRWAGAALPEEWTPSASTQSSFRDLYGLGEIRGLTGGEYATLLFRDGIVRGDYLGQNPYFQWDEVEGAVGCDLPATVLRSKNVTYYWATEGWQAFNGAEVRPIGTQKVDEWFRGKLKDRTRIFPLSFLSLSSVGWLFVSNDTPNNKPDRIIFYNYVLDRWSNARVSGEVMGSAVPTAALTLEDLGTATLEELPGSFDDPLYTGSTTTRGALWVGPNAGEGLQLFIGPSLMGVLETPAFQMADGRRGRMAWARPTLTGANPHVIHKGWSGHYENGVGRTPSSSGRLPQARNGKFMMRREALWHRLRLEIDGPWEKARSIEWAGSPGSGR